MQTKKEKKKLPCSDRFPLHYILRYHFGHRGNNLETDFVLNTHLNYKIWFKKKVCRSHLQFILLILRIMVTEYYLCQSYHHQCCLACIFDQVGDCQYIQEHI